MSWKRQELAGAHSVPAAMFSLTMVSMLHGTMQGYVMDSYSKNGTECTADMRQALERQLSRS